MRDRVAHAKEIIADLKAAGGWDLSGWEHFFAEEAAYVSVVAPEVHIERNQAAFKSSDGTWKPLALIALRVEDHQEVIDAFSSIGVQQKIAGLRTREFELECFDNDAAREFATMDGVVEFGVGLDDGTILTEKIIVTSYDIEFSLSGSPGRITIEMVVTQ